ncbi:MAG: mucoidy inhibitor MuiA family protein [Spirochaetales bacterium]|nr:mucoidy inhibitor MuiA family protein [Spirochaetales bacterium]
MANVLIKQEDINLETDSVAKEVIVYSGKAQIKRVKKTELRKGENCIVFSNLGSDIDEQSIKSDLSHKNARIVSTSLQRNFLYFFKEEENEKIFTSILECLKKMIASLDDKSIYALENHFTGDLRDYIQDLLNDIFITQENSIPKLSEALEFLKKRMDLNSHQIIAINEDLDNLTLEYGILSEKLKKIRELDKKVQNNIEVMIFSEEDCLAEVEISYILPHITWRPSYDAKLNTETKKIEFLYYGEINNASGEELHDVHVSLSTSETVSLVEIPKIFPVYISGYVEKRTHELTVEESVTRGLKEDEGEADGSPKDTPTVVEKDTRVEVKKKGAAHTFTVTKPCTIPSDAEWHRFLILQSEIDSVLYYETIPEYLEYIYLKATLKNSTGIPFLQGKVSVYRNESYMGQSTLTYTSIDEEFSLSFGIDEDLRVKRIQCKNLSKPAKGLVGKHFREWEYHFILYNYKKEKKRVLIKEGVYVSELNEVTVKMSNDTSPDYTLTKDGIIQWEAEIPPDPFQHIKLVLHYTLTAPKSFSLDAI